MSSKIAKYLRKHFSVNVAKFNNFHFKIIV